MTAFLGGIFGIGGIAALIWALPPSYAVEARSRPQRRGGLPGYTNIWAVVLNIGVARDAETQALRAKVLQRMAIVAAMMCGLLAVGVLR